MKIELNEHFKKAIDLMENSDRSLFITGKAGSGKSTLLSYFTNNTKKNVAVLAPTGVSALNIKGETIHSFFKFNPSISIEEAAKKGKRAKKNSFYHEVDLIIIDEISMVRADLLDCVDVFLKACLNNAKPFGNIRIVFIGDLYQLPPVVTREQKEIFNSLYETPYFFSSNVMKDQLFKPEFIELEKIYRQNDLKFIELLNGIRNNTITDEQISILNQRLDEKLEFESGYIYLATTNDQAEKINHEMLEKLEDKTFTFDATIDGDFEKKTFPTSCELKLKKNAQVMFLVNSQDGLFVNGTIGKINKIDDSEIEIITTDNELIILRPHKWDLFKYDFDSKTKKLNQETIGSFKQYPIKLAWAITIHKSQGQTFEKVIIDLSRGIFAHGQTYVALSRCKSFEGLKLKKPIKKSHIILDHKVINFLTEFQYMISNEKCSKKDKISIIQDAIVKKRKLDITYLKTTDEKTQRTIVPSFVGELSYNNTKYIGVIAFCTKRQEDRVFKIERILEISESKTI